MSDQKKPSLPISDQELDELILSHAKNQWLKVARVIGDVLRVANSNLGEGQKIESRIKMLVDSGRLESAGDVSNWRFSEIRLPDGISKK